MEVWKRRFELIIKETQLIPPGDTSSRAVRTKDYWEDFKTINEVIRTGNLISYWIEKKVERQAFCIFEFIYFSRPDSKIFGENVDKVRRKLGKFPLCAIARFPPL